MAAGSACDSMSSRHSSRAPAGQPLARDDLQRRLWQQELGQAVRGGGQRGARATVVHGGGAGGQEQVERGRVDEADLPGRLGQLWAVRRIHRHHELGVRDVGDPGGDGVDQRGTQDGRGPAAQRHAYPPVRPPVRDPGRDGGRAVGRDIPDGPGRGQVGLAQAGRRRVEDQVRDGQATGPADRGAAVGQRLVGVREHVVADRVHSPAVLDQRHTERRRDDLPGELQRVADDQVRPPVPGHRKGFGQYLADAFAPHRLELRHRRHDLRARLRQGPGAGRALAALLHVVVRRADHKHRQTGGGGGRGQVGSADHPYLVTGRLERPGQRDDRSQVGGDGAHCEEYPHLTHPPRRAAPAAPRRRRGSVRRLSRR